MSNHIYIARSREVCAFVSEDAIYKIDKNEYAQALLDSDGCEDSAINQLQAKLECERIHYDNNVDEICDVFKVSSKKLTENEVKKSLCSDALGNQ